MTIKALTVSSAALTKVATSPSPSTVVSTARAALENTGTRYTDAFEPLTRRSPALESQARKYAVDVDLRSPARSYFVEQNLADPALDAGDVGLTTDTKNQELYGVNGPVLEDVKQGQLDDCWLMASIGSLVHADPQAVKNMIRDNGDGTYGVRLFAETPAGSGSFTASWVTVDDDFPRHGLLMPSDRELYADAGDGDHDGRQEIWVALIEKAFVQHMQTNFPAEGMGYGALNNDLISKAMGALTGNPTSVRMTANTDAQTMWSELQRVNQGGLVSAATPKDGTLMPGLSQPHCYTVTGVVEVNGHRFVDLRNPLGSGEPFDGGRPSDGVFRLTYEDFRANFSEVASQTAPD
ncbi:MAG: hypothetical protein JNK82_24575 [Myxococcaceae bacterium]|nr:hypothetical protein [Myxococcaceae bacterium]